MGLLFAMTIPGLALALLAVAAVEVLVRRRRDRTRGLGVTGLDELGAVVYGSRRAELDERARLALVREDASDAAPDLDRGVVRLRRPPTA